MNTQIKHYLSPYMEFFLLINSIILVSNTSTLVFNDGVLLIYLIFLFILFIINKIKYDMSIVYIVILWLIINFLSYLYNGTSFNFATIIGYLIRLLTAYFTLKIIGESFWSKFEKLIFILTAISLPIFLLNILFPSFFSSLSIVFGNWAADFYKLKPSQYNYWYSVLYTCSGKISLSDLRNSGFMWEPGAFAMMIIFGLLYNMYRDNFNLSLKILVYIIALITTFSTMGYIALLLISMLYILNKNSTVFKIIFVFIVILIVPLLLNLDFLLPKLELYITKFNDQDQSLQVHTGRYEVNRLLSFYFDIEKVLKFPLGHGVIPDKFEVTIFGRVIVGVNGLGKIIKHWGIFGFVYLFYLLKKFVSIVLKKNTSNINIIVTILIITVTFFSNPIEKNFYFFAIVLTPLIYEFKSKRIKYRLLQG